MEAMELMRMRHSVRQYQDKPIPDEIRKQLKELTDQCNKEGELHIQIIYDEPDCFNSRMAHYGRFENCRNYIAMIGRKSQGLEERCGYYGEKIVLLAQQLGLNTCWAALTFNKKIVKEIIPDGESLCMVISLGYGETQGVGHKIKTVEQVSSSKNVSDITPSWFKGTKVTAKTAGIGTNLKTDLGIVKYHFEAGSGKGKEIWT